MLHICWGSKQELLFFLLVKFLVEHGRQGHSWIQKDATDDGAEGYWKLTSYARSSAWDSWEDSTHAINHLRELLSVLKFLCWFLDANQLLVVKVPSLSLKGREEGTDPGKPTCSWTCISVTISIETVKNHHPFLNVTLLLVMHLCASLRISRTAILPLCQL